jgi:hypothetical protein
MTARNGILLSTERCVRGDSWDCRRTRANFVPFLLENKHTPVKQEAVSTRGSNQSGCFREISDKTGLWICLEHEIDTLFDESALQTTNQCITNPAAAVPCDGLITIPDRLHRLIVQAGGEI